MFHSLEDKSYLGMQLSQASNFCTRPNYHMGKIVYSIEAYLCSITKKNYFEIQESEFCGTSDPLFLEEFKTRK